MSNLPVRNLALGLIGAIVGGVLGCFVFQWVARQGFYAPIPGALVGLGFSLASRKRHQLFGVICAILGLVAGLAAEWMTFKSDASLAEFLGGLRNEPPMTWIILAIGVVLAYSFGVGRDVYRPQQRDLSAKVKSGNACVGGSHTVSAQPKIHIIRMFSPSSINR